jgi:hypothetical protein
MATIDEIAKIRNRYNLRSLSHGLVVAEHADAQTAADLALLVVAVDALRARAERSEMERDEAKRCAVSDGLEVIAELDELEPRCPYCGADADGEHDAEECPHADGVTADDMVVRAVRALADRAERAEVKRDTSAGFAAAIQQQNVVDRADLVAVRKELHDFRTRMSIYISKLYSEAQMNELRAEVVALHKVRDAAEAVCKLADMGFARDGAFGGVVDALRSALTAARGEEKEHGV